jgi:hypothetical protein
MVTILNFAAADHRENKDKRSFECHHPNDSSHIIIKRAKTSPNGVDISGFGANSVIILSIKASHSLSK